MHLAVTVTGIARRILDVLLVVLIAFVVATVILARVIPILTGGTTFVVGGGSMDPTIPLGSVVVATPVPADDLAVGDVVSLRVGEQRAIFTHRIVRLVPRDGGVWLETKGDANAAPDPAIVPATTVIGRVALALPFAGYAVRLLSSLQGDAFLVALGVFVLAGAWLLESLEEDQRRALRRRAEAAGGALMPDTHPEQGMAG